MITELDNKYYCCYNNTIVKQGVEMSKLLITTQVRENYGSLDAPHWKSKGGSDYVIKNFVSTESLEHLITSIRDQIEIDNPFYQEHIICYNVVSDDHLTRDERLQLEFEGKITYVPTELHLA